MAPLSRDTRYPEPDPNDPFAPLWVLRTRSSNPAIPLNPLSSSNPRRRFQSIRNEPLVVFPPSPSLLTDTTSESGSTTDVDTLAPVPSKRVLNIPRHFLTRLSSNSSPPRATKNYISPPHVPSPLPDLAPLRRAVTSNNSAAPSILETDSSTISRKPPATLKKPAPPVPSQPTDTLIAPRPVPKLDPIPTRLPRRPNSSHITASPSFAPHPHVSPPPDPEWHPPTPAQLAHAASLSVIAQSGLRVSFASLFAAQRTVVVFVRHFWCPLCQDYMSTLVSAAQPHRMFAPPEEEKGAVAGTGTQPVHLVVIANGSHAFIPKYRQLFNLPFEMYTDPELRVYRALGMGRDGGAQQAVPRLSSGNALTHNPPLLDGGYVRHGLVGGIAMVVMRALRTGMPVWEKGGDIDQLGGEFVLGPGLQCSYAHRMQTPKGHAPITDVLKAAGVVVPAPPPATVFLRLMKRSNSTGHMHGASMEEFGVGHGGARASRTAAGKLEGRTHTRVSVSVSIPARPRDSSVPLTQDEEAQWMEGRAEALERLRARKSARRGAFVGCFSGSGGEAGGVGGYRESGGCERGGLCSPVWEEDGEVLVIGFAEEHGDGEVVLCKS